ncbi:MAG: Crp/Fnr family transcriptional regulator [Polyangiales bacterium]
MGRELPSARAVLGSSAKSDRVRRGEASRSWLADVRLFDGVDEAGLSRMLAPGRFVETSKGEMILERGTIGDQLYVIQRGRYQVTATDRAGRRVTLSVLGPSDVFGEVSMVDGCARSADVISVGTGRLLVVERPSFVELATTYPTIGWTLTTVVARRLRRLTERLEDRAFLDLEKRLAKRLVEAAEDVGGTTDGRLMRGIRIALTQNDLAAIVDASRERVNRQLATWVKDGLVGVERSRIALLDPEGLRRVYEGGTEREVDRSGSPHGPG